MCGPQKVECSLYVIGDWCFEFHGLATVWMAERQAIGMQRLPPNEHFVGVGRLWRVAFKQVGTGDFTSAAVERVCQHRMPESQHVNAELMRSTRFGEESH